MPNCKNCPKAKHSTANCPKKREFQPKGGPGRGLSTATKQHKIWLNVLIDLVDHDSLFDDGAKSLVGGDKGKNNTLGEGNKSVRIDRQGKGNVQFQVKKESYAQVIFTQDASVPEIFQGLRDSMATGQEVSI